MGVDDHGLAFLGGGQKLQAEQEAGEELDAGHAGVGGVFGYQVEGAAQFFDVGGAEDELVVAKARQLLVEGEGKVPVQAEQVVGVGQVDLEGIELAGVAGGVPGSVDFEGEGEERLVAHGGVVGNLAVLGDLVLSGPLDHAMHFQHVGVVMHGDGGQGGREVPVGEVAQPPDAVLVPGDGLLFFGPAEFIKNFVHRSS